MDINALYRLWLEKAAGHPALREELEAIRGDDAAIEDRFYRDLDFGTGGLRGVLGAGTNRMNVYTVGQRHAGTMPTYLKAAVLPPRSSPLPTTAASTRRALCARPRRVFLPPTASTRTISIRAWSRRPRCVVRGARSTAAGRALCVTASHNPAAYNGYKVYGADGCQITTEAAACHSVRTLTAWIPSRMSILCDFAEGARLRHHRLYRRGHRGARISPRYRAASLLPEDVSRSASIVYTPLNGTGISCVPRCLRAHGFTNITIPPEQAEPDGTFPTCPYPNPEIREALSVGLRLAEKTGSELLLATDPDCDRVGAAVKTAEGYRLITGNEMGVLLLDFVCRMRRANGTMPERPVAVKTIVTTPMAEKVAAHYGVELRNVLTGFKYIGEQIGLLEKDGEADRYIFGFEESYGYLSGSFVRDKDAVNASLLICEMFIWYKSQGKTLADALEALYTQYGFYEAKLLSFTFEGSAGFAHMTELLDSLRVSPPEKLAGETVRQVIDYDRDETGLPRSNVLRFVLDGGEVVVRPSGTEPKLKIYLTAARESREKSRAMLALLEKRLTDWAK